MNQTIKAKKLKAGDYLERSGEVFRIVNIYKQPPKSGMTYTYCQIDKKEVPVKSKTEVNLHIQIECMDKQIYYYDAFIVISANSRVTRLNKAVLDLLYKQTQP